MTLANHLLRAVGGEEKLYVDDVFSTYLYKGNGSTQTINNGIDLAGKGGLVWQKSRSNADSHALIDTERGRAKYLASNSTGAQGNNPFSDYDLTSFNSNGFSLGTAYSASMNESGKTYTSWTFRRAPKFFDVVTYTGDGTAGRQIPHELGIAPGMVIVKKTSAAGDWCVWHRSIATQLMYLNYTNAQNADFVGDGTNTFETFSENGHTATTFGIGGSSSQINTNGATYVAYLFAHDPTTDGIIQCGSFKTDGSGNATVNLGWEPQYVLSKQSNETDNWAIRDVMRVNSWSSSSSNDSNAQLYPNTSEAEAIGNTGTSPTSTGFSVHSGQWVPGSTVIYLAIRRPNKPPTTGTQAYNSVTRNGTGTAPWVASGAGFAPDMTIMSARNSSAVSRVGISYANSVIDRLRIATEHIQTINNDGEGGGWGAGHIHNMNGYDGLYTGDASYFNYNGGMYVDHHFKRASGVFDIVCYAGTGANKTESHNLTKAPELWITKRRNTTGSWAIGSSLLNASEKIVMPSPNGRVTDATAWNSTYPTATALSLGTQTDINASGGTYVAYLWASAAGISKVFTYTGNGTSQTVNCGFTTGARFVMIIRVTASTAQDIYFWDSARGITSGNDPRLSLNVGVLEVTTLDTIDPVSSGFIVNTDASNVNVNGAVYIGLAYA